MVEAGLKATGFEEVGLLSLSSADHSEIADIAKGLADRYEEDKIGLSLPSTRVDAFNIDLANELTRNGRRSGLTFAPEGGCERIRKVINKMVSEEDLIRTVTTAYGNGWRQVKLYFMCGLPTETDEDVLQIADMATQGHRQGPRGHRRRTTSAAPSPSAASCPSRTPRSSGRRSSAPRRPTPGCSKLRDAIRGDKKYGRSIGFRYHDGKPGIVEGLLSRGDRRVGAVIRAVYEDGGRFDGWSEHFSYDRWMRARRRRRCPQLGVDVDWYTTRERDRRGGPALGPPRLRPGQGLALGGLAGRPRRDRGRGLPLDPVLRLRGLPADGHRDPDRPDGQEAAAADGGRRAGQRRQSVTPEG